MSVQVVLLFLVAGWAGFVGGRWRGYRRGYQDGLWARRNKGALEDEDDQGIPVP